MLVAQAVIERRLLLTANSPLASFPRRSPLAAFPCRSHPGGLHLRIPNLTAFLCRTT
jgi:hypothetical protein